MATMAFGTFWVSRSIRYWLLAALVCLFWLVRGPVPLELQAADQLEENLVAEMLTVRDHLQSKHYHNVGVLKFRVQKGNEPETFSAGTLNVVMATRVENALILHNDKADPIRIIRDASHVAADHKEHAGYLNPGGCAKLFRYRYPLAWGDEMVEADAFVTGLVKIQPLKTKVVIEVIDRQTQTRQEVSSFSVRTERSLLTDVCENFVLSPRNIRTMQVDLQDEAAAKNAEQRRTEKRRVRSEDEQRVVKLQILYNGIVQDETVSEAHPGANEIHEPQQGDKVTFRLTNTADRPVAVILAVNGKSTLYEEDLQGQAADRCIKWILEPGVANLIEGFYQRDDKTVAPFKVLSKEESAEEEEQNTHPRLGAVELIVFDQGRADKSGRKPGTNGLRQPLPADKSLKPRSSREAARQVREASQLAPRAAGILKADKDNAEGTDLRTVSFDNPVLMETRVIWYHARNKPRGDAAAR
jgi:hypothetical protein